MELRTPSPVQVKAAADPGSLSLSSRVHANFCHHPPLGSPHFAPRSIATLCKTLSLGLFSAAMVLGTGAVVTATTFKAPGEAAPQHSLGGGVRGQAQFAAPGSVAPANSLGGGTRGTVQFAIPGQLAPSNSQGGGTRGVAQFSAPGQVAPQNSLGGGSRGVVQFAVPGQAAPRNSTSGGTRTAEVVDLAASATDSNPDATIALAWNFPQDSALPLALVPDPQQISYTLETHPTFFVYLPPLGAEQVFFSLQDESGEPVYHALLTVPTEGGIIRFTLPEDAPELALNQNYVWFFVPIEPGASLRPDSPAAVAWIKRVDVAVGASAAETAALETAGKTPEGVPTIDRAVALAEAGIWHDTLAVISAGIEQENQTLPLALTAEQTPDSSLWVKEWQDLLQSVGLLQEMP
ncbi:MAG: DUF928 domain-containing protein [Prochlorothrix sp.]